MESGETPPAPQSKRDVEAAAPPSHRGAEAPIARLDKSLVTVATRRPRIRLADVAIIGSALAVIALSIAALVWVLH